MCVHKFALSGNLQCKSVMNMKYTYLDLKHGEIFDGYGIEKKVF